MTITQKMIDAQRSFADAIDVRGYGEYAVSQDPLAAVRERIAEMRSAAAEDRASAAGWRDDIDGPDTEHAAYNERRAESLEWAANALEAVLKTRDDWAKWIPPTAHEYACVRDIDAALARATATTEGKR